MVYMPSQLLYFVFSCYGDHLDLHSFPTRRSSDLGNVVAVWLGVDQVADRCFFLEPLAPPHRIDRLLRREGLDRKSTRLNSSHRCISYAVFCLKKKKNHTH